MKWSKFVMYRQRQLKKHIAGNVVMDHSFDEYIKTNYSCTARTEKEAISKARRFLSSAQISISSFIMVQEEEPTPYP